MKLHFIILSSVIVMLSGCASVGVIDTDKDAMQSEPEIVVATKYEPLVYGAQKPLVCSQPYAQEGKLSTRPNMQVMWENYLYDRPEGIWSEIGGAVEINGNLPLDQGRWTNACTVRLSHMFNKAGYKIKKDGGKTVSGASFDQYYYRVNDFEPYLLAEFGPPDVAIVDGSGNGFDLPDRPGIVLMDFPDGSFTGHVTIWNGAGTVDGAEVGGFRVLFWDLPCFIPEGRDAPAIDETAKTASLQSSSAALHLP